jgi:hypothetical protein
MNELLKQRIARRLEALSDERGYQILDYVEFIESKYAERSAAGGFFSKLTETAEDTMRAVGLPIKAVSGTMGLMESAGKVMKGVAAAAQSVVDEAVKAAGSQESRSANRETPLPPQDGSEGPKPA